MLSSDEYIAAYDGELKARMIALRALTHTKSPLHLPYSQPMPWELLREMVDFCVQEHLK